MLKKLHLDRTLTYERAIATVYMAKMVVGYLEGTAHSRCLGCEQGDIPNWDDLVLVNHDGVFEHVQVKRQETDFDGAYSTTRGMISKGPRIGNPQDLSELDKAMVSLATWFRPDSIGNVNSGHRFTLGIPHGNVLVKKGLEIRHFQALCGTCQNPTITVAGLESLAVGDPTTGRLYEWLTSWCEFAGWSHILSTLQALTILTWGTEPDLNAVAEDKLATHFHLPSTVRAAISHFIDDNATFAGATTPRTLLILNGIKDSLKPSRTTWTQYRRNGTGMTWAIAGTHGNTDTGIELPSSVVSALWSESGLQRTLRVAAPWLGVSLPLLPNSLARLALHLPPPAQALFDGVDAWRIGVSSSIGGTVGSDHRDLVRLPWVNETRHLNPSDIRPVSSTAEQREEAERLSLAMDLKTWEMVSLSVRSKIENIPDPGLQAGVELSWAQCLADLTADSQKRSQFLKKMLHAAAEGENIIAQLRIGPLTVELLAEGLILHLIVAVALGGTSTTWDSLDHGRTMRTLALNHWAGPAGRRTQPCPIDEDGISLLGKENADVVILSGCQGPPGEIEEESLAADASLCDNFAMPRSPKLLVTNCLTLRRMIRSGTLPIIRQYLNDEIQRREAAPASKINQQPVG